MHFLTLQDLKGGKKWGRPSNLINCTVQIFMILRIKSEKWALGKLLAMIISLLLLTYFYSNFSHTEWPCTDSRATNSIHVWLCPKSHPHLDLPSVCWVCPYGHPTTNSMCLTWSHSSHLLPPRSALLPAPISAPVTVISPAMEALLSPPSHI